MLTKVPFTNTETDTTPIGWRFGSSDIRLPNGRYVRR